MKRDSFILTRGIVAEIWALPTDDERIAMFDAVINYGLDGIMPIFAGKQLALFERLRIMVDKCNAPRKRGEK